MRYLIILITLLLLSCSLDKQPSDGLEFALIYDADGNTAYEVYRGTATAKHILISESYMDIPITHIGIGGFRAHTTMTKITLPHNLKFIDTESFSGCTVIIKLNIPKNLDVIGTYAFEGCNRLSGITIPRNVNYLGTGAFSGCTNLRSVTFEPYGQILYILAHTFEDCVNLNNIIIPDAVNHVGANAFANTGIWNNTPENSVVYADKWVVGYKGDLTGELVLREDTIGISVEAFAYQQALTNIVLPEGLRYINDNAFNGCTSLTDISIPSSVVIVGNQAFHNTGMWRDTPNNNVVYADNWAVGVKGEIKGILHLQDNTVGIGMFAFLSQYEMISVNLPSGIRYINEFAFAENSSLSSVFIPKTVEQVGDYVFDNCYYLTIYTDAVGDADDWHGHSPVVWDVLSKAPRELFVSVGDHEIKLRWIPPDIENLEIIQGYRVFFNDNAVTDIIQELEFTDYIQPGQPKYHVTAVFINGSESASESLTLINTF